MSSAILSLRTARLLLFRASALQTSALIEGADEYHRTYGHGVAEGLIEFPGSLEFSIDKYHVAGTQGDWWLPWLFLHEASQTVAGMGGFKGPPDALGAIEFGYSIAPAHRGQGLATEAAAALANYALGLPQVRVVRAHTLPEKNASTRVLTKCGLVHVGSVQDPDDGTVWRWELSRVVRPSAA